MNFTVKVYPQVIWGEKYRGNFEALADDIVKASISNVVVPAFQGMRIFFSQPMDQSENPWSLLPLKKICQQRGLGFALELSLFHDRDSFEKFESLRPQSPDGEIYPSTEWYRPVCPSNEAYAQRRLQFCEEALRFFEPTLVTVNFLWYPYWPSGQDWETLGSQAPSFCFCDSCRSRFTAATGLFNAAQDVEAWFAFRANILSELLADLEELTQNLKSPPSLILEIPPAPTPYFAERLRRLSGIHLGAWRNLIQVIAPQFFYNECGLSFEWACEALDELRAFGYSLFPQIDLPAAIADKKEMRAELHAFLDTLESAEIGAVMIHSWEALRSQPDVIDILAAFKS
jgi:hypothetical protein